jgi:hypothetical protein
VNRNRKYWLKQIIYTRRNIELKYILAKEMESQKQRNIDAIMTKDF